MANILDIFRTHVGNELMEKTGEETGLNPKEIHRAYIFTLPFVLSVHRSKCDQGTNHSKEFASELENSVDQSSEAKRNRRESLCKHVLFCQAGENNSFKPGSGHFRKIA